MCTGVETSLEPDLFEEIGLGSGQREWSFKLLVNFNSIVGIENSIVGRLSD